MSEYGSDIDDRALLSFPGRFEEGAACRRTPFRAVSALPTPPTVGKSRAPRLPRKLKLQEWDSDLSNSQNNSRLKKHSMAVRRRGGKAQLFPGPFWESTGPPSTIGGVEGRPVELFSTYKKESVTSQCHLQHLRLYFLL